MVVVDKNTSQEVRPEIKTLTAPYWPYASALLIQAFSMHFQGVLRLIVGGGGIQPYSIHLGLTPLVRPVNWCLILCTFYVGIVYNRGLLIEWKGGATGSTLHCERPILRHDSGGRRCWMNLPAIRRGNSIRCNHEANAAMAMTGRRRIPWL